MKQLLDGLWSAKTLESYFTKLIILLITRQTNLSVDGLWSVNSKPCDALAYTPQHGLSLATGIYVIATMILDSNIIKIDNNNTPPLFVRLISMRLIISLFI